MLFPTLQILVLAKLKNHDFDDNLIKIVEKVESILELEEAIGKWLKDKNGKGGTNPSTWILHLVFS